MLKLIKYLKPYLLQILILFILVYLQVQATLKLPDYTADIVNKGIVGSNQQLIIDTGIQMLIVTVLGAICTILVGFLASRIGTGFARNLRSRIYKKVESFSLVEFNKFSASSLITRSTNDIQQIQLVLVLLLRMISSAPLTAIGAVIKAYENAPNMTWIMALSVVTLITVIIVVFSIAIPKFSLVQKLVDKLNLVTRENLNGIRVIRAFNAERYEQEKFGKVNTDLTKVNLFVNRLTSLMMPIMMLIMNLTVVLIVWVSSKFISTNDLQIGNMLAFMQYAMQVIFSFLMLSFIFILIPRASVSGRRISEVLETIPEIKNPEKPDKTNTNTKGVIEFKNVTFKYPQADTPVLQNISFISKPSETTAIIGSTGSGKSTLINLIPRFYDVTEGQILIDGIDIREMKMEDLHSKIGYVPQKGFLFSGSIKSNIKFGNPDGNDEQMIKSAEISQAKEFIDNMQEKYNFPISESGTNVSGGQKQRLAIARALYINPEIFIFDDSFSAVDYRTDASLRKALKENVKNSTILIVAQRISTIMNADQIIVLDEGKISGIGKHIDLLKSCNVYKEIANSQLSEEELSNIN